MAAGRDAVVNPVAILHGSETDFAGALVPLPTTLASACHARGVRRLRHVGALGVASDSPSRHQPSKAHGEQVLRDADADLTVLRPGGVFGTGDPFLKRFADLQSVFPAAPLAGSRARVLARADRRRDQRGGGRPGRGRGGPDHRMRGP